MPKSTAMAVMADRFIENLNASGLEAHSAGLRGVAESGEFHETRADRVVELRANNQEWLILVEVKNRAPTAADIAQLSASFNGFRAKNPRVIPCLVVPRLLDRHRVALRDAGISHADLRGVLYIKAPGLLIDVERKISYDDDELADIHAESTRDPDIFGDRSSLILRALTHHVQEPVRSTRLAERTGITAGWISQVLRELKRRGYVARTAGGVVLANPVQLLMDWPRAYDWKKNHVRRYQVDFPKEEILNTLASARRRVRGSEKVDYLLTLHTGAALFAPHVENAVVTLYAPPAALSGVMSLIVDRMFGVATTSAGNLQVVSPFYEKSIHFDAGLVDGQPVVSLLQLYLDLVRYPVRGAEAASMLLRGPLRDLLHLTRLQQKSLLQAIG
jgi:DNA-binding HxlR family transcriptional regulator